MTSIKVLNYILRQRSQIISRIPISSTAFNTNVIRRYSSQKSSSDISKVENNEAGGVQPFAGGFAENAKCGWSMFVILAGVGITGLIGFTVLKELFGRTSPHGVYTRAVERCLKEPKVIDALGEPIKAYGEESSRGRRRHVRHTSYTQGDKEHMRMQFYMKGIRKRGTVHLEIVQDDWNNFNYRYMFIQLDDLLQTVIVVEDNRASEVNSRRFGDMPSLNSLLTTQE